MMTEIATAAPAGHTLSESRRATIAGTLLLFTSCLPLLGATLLIPNLANIARVFHDTQGLALMVSLVATAPGAMIGLMAPFAGALSDKLGRKRLLIVSAVAYSIVGVAPVFLETLQGIVISRVLLGVCEAVIMTVCTALIADYFEGSRRVKYLSLQTVFTAISAVVFVLIGGMAAQGGWRAPFWIYAFGIVLAIPLAIFAWEPVARSRTRGDNQGPMAVHAPVVKLRTPWRHLALPIAFTLFSGIACHVVTINASFLFPARGYTHDPAAIGILTSIMSAGVAISALSFRWLAKWGSWRLLPIAYAAQAAGLMLVAFVDSVPAAIIGGVIGSLAFGIQLPALITWALGGNFDVGVQGRASGLWTSAFWIGTLLFSFIYTGLVAALGNQFAAVGGFAVAAAVVAVAAFLLVPRSPSLFTGAAHSHAH